MTPSVEFSGDLRSRYIDCSDIPWKASDFPGIEFKLLYADAASGMSTILFRMAPGAVVPPHTHMAVEQTFMLQGSLQDDEGRVTTGNFVWRPAGNQHTAHSPEGAVYLSIFMKPNRFQDGQRFFTQT